MKCLWLQSILLTSLLVPSLAIKAGPIEFNTPEVYILVIRPIDSWSSDKSRNEDSIETIKEKLVAFKFADSSGQIRDGGPTSIFSSRDSITDPVAKSVDAKLLALGADYTNKSINFTFFHPPYSLAPSEMNSFIEAEKKLFQATVIHNGNPAGAEASTGRRKILGGILSTGLTLLSMGKLGVNTGSALTLGTGLSADIEQATRTFGKALAPIPLPNVDFSNFREVEVRKVTTGDQLRIGQVVIAYRNEKSKEIEETALSKAIVMTFGIDDSIENIEASRRADFSLRQSIWDQCVREEKCNKE